MPDKFYIARSSIFSSGSDLGKKHFLMFDITVYNQLEFCHPIWCNSYTLSSLLLLSGLNITFVGQKINGAHLLSKARKLLRKVNIDYKTLYADNEQNWMLPKKSSRWKDSKQCEWEETAKHSIYLVVTFMRVCVFWVKLHFL